MRLIRPLLFLLLAALGSPALAGPAEEAAAAYQRGDYATAMTLYRPLAERGDAVARTAVGTMFAHGQGVARDPAAAVSWLEGPAGRGNPTARVELASLWFAGGDGVEPDVGRMLSWMREGADRGDPGSQYNLALIYRLGLFGVPRDTTRALAVWRGAAEHGHIPSQIKLGELFHTGLTVTKDDAEAARWFLRAAEAGDKGAQFAIGSMLADGMGVAKDHVAALKWLHAAARDDPVNRLALAEIARIEREDAPFTPPPADFEWLQQRAVAGYAWAQLKLGQVYGDEKSAVRDDAQAVMWFGQAAKQGSAEAASAAATMATSGRGDQAEMARKLAATRAAAEIGNAKSQYELSIYYFLGVYGLAKDPGESLVWLRKSADQGFVSAQRDLGLSLTFGLRGPRDPEQAAQWHLKAAEQGDPISELSIGMAYEKGWGVAADKARALAWYRKLAYAPGPLLEFGKAGVERLERESGR